VSENAADPDDGADGLDGGRDDDSDGAIAADSDEVAAGSDQTAAGSDGAADAAAAETASVELPASVVATLERRVDRTEFETVDEYAAFALELLLREVDRADDDPTAADASDGSSDDSDDGSTDGPDDEVADRLESLGYL